MFIHCRLISISVMREKYAICVKGHLLFNCKDRFVISISRKSNAEFIYSGFMDSGVLGNGGKSINNSFSSCAA